MIVIVVMDSQCSRYWEAKLAPGHMPSENKIENYIRTKYESKRWVMDGPMPDPSTLDDGEGSAVRIILTSLQLLFPDIHRRQPWPHQRHRAVPLLRKLYNKT
jgi:hypothetical protein